MFADVLGDAIGQFLDSSRCLDGPLIFGAGAFGCAPTIVQFQSRSPA